MSEDMMRDRQRQKWEEDALEELSEETGPVHYQDVQHHGSFLFFRVLFVMCTVSFINLLTISPLVSSVVFQMI